MLSYGGLIFGLPLGIVPIIQRDDAFALFHAKRSLVIALEFLALFALYFAGFAFAFIAFFFTCGLPCVPAVHGLLSAINGEMREPMGTFGLADRIFYNVVLK